MESMRTAADLQRLYFRVNANGTETFIPLPQYGVTFLLGKNGAGKTSLLNGLGKLFGSATSHHFDVSVITDSQSPISDEIWNDYRHHEVGDYDRTPYEWLDSAPRLIECIRQHRELTSIMLPKGITPSGFEIARDFGFRESEIPDFVSKEYGLIYEGENPSVAQFFEWRLPSTLNLRLEPAVIFLESLAQSTIEKTDASIEYWYADLDGTEPEIWLLNQERKRLLADAFRQFSETLKIEWRISRGQLQLRYISERPISGPLHSVLELLEAEVEALSQKLVESEKTDPWNGIYKFFPHDLFQSATLQSGSAVATKWQTIASHWRSFDLSGNHGWLFDKLSISGVSKVNDELKASEEAFLARHITNSLCEIEEDKVRLEFTGISAAKDALALLSQDFRNFDIGITSLELDLRDMTPFNDDGLEFPIEVSIKWKDAIDGKLRPLIEASDGQKVIMSTILALSAQDESANGLLIIDEFDRGLHPTAAKALAGLIDILLQRSEGIGILSTHNPSLTTSIDNANWYSSRDALGNFTISSSLGDPSVASQEMGVDELDAYRLKNLIVLGEGMHEDLILGKLFASNSKISDAIWFMTANGINNYSLAWQMSLRLFSMPVLMIYDKKNERLEQCIRQLHQLQHADDPWTACGLQQLADELQEAKKQAQRDGLAPPDGHHELSKMLTLMKEVIDHDGASRLLVHGIDVPDIVDCLEPRFFRNVSTWESAHAAAKEKRLTGEAFKKVHKIDRSRIEKALSDPDFTWHPELQKLYSRICGLLGISDIDF
jgi:hypothetical protein